MPLLPAGFFYAGKDSLMGQLPEAQTTHPELTEVGSRTAAQLATVIAANLKLGLSFSFGD